MSAPSEPYPPAPLLASSLPPRLVQQSIAFLARVLINSGVLQFLEDKAKKTSTPYDDLAIRFAINGINALADL